MPVRSAWTPTDFDHRASPATLPELMDEPCSYEEFRACLRDLERVNRLTFGYRPTLRWLEQFASGAQHAAPLRILDAGCGGGDALRRIERWAARRKLAVQLTGVDLNPYAARAAREFTPPGSRIEWVTADALAFTPNGGPPDVITSSLMTHHLEDDVVVRLLAWMERTARRGWFINDLCRSHDASRGFSLLATIFRWHPFVRHDGPVSFRRAFRPEDWQRYLEAAGIGAQSVRVESVRPGRLCVGRVKAAP